MAQDFFDIQKQFIEKLNKLQEVLKNKPFKAPVTLEVFQNSMMKIGTKFWQNVWENPQHMWDAQKRFIDLMQQTQKPQASTQYDRFFKAEEWNTEPFYQWLKTIYIQTAEWVIETIEEEALGFNQEEKAKLLFMAKQWIEGANPRNFPLTNPEIIKEMIESRGENFIRGIDNLIKDIENGRVSMTDETAFQIGKNIATTKGKVIYQNKMMELIHYTPTTETVFIEPLVIIPPWINKYYILDLTAENSFIKWLVDQGHSVFCISWANPDETFRDIGFKDYMHDGALKAIEIATKTHQSKTANVMGYCIGGTLLAMTLAWLKGQKNTPSSIGTATFITTLLDFENAGDLKVFIDRDQVESINHMLVETGVMDGKAMSLTFSLLRASDLIWSFVINNYFLGKDPMAFDILFWNSDSTNLPAAMHSDYLKSMYLDNVLAKGQYILNNVTLDLSKIDTPTYFLATQDDHIAPCHAIKDGIKLLGNSHSTFVIGGSGHVAGVINPPHKNKYGFEVDGKKYDGSWWVHWQKWIETQNKTKIKPPKPLPLQAQKAYSDAPGTYVLKRI